MDMEVTGFGVRHLVLISLHSLVPSLCPRQAVQPNHPNPRQRARTRSIHSHYTSNNERAGRIVRVCFPPIPPSFFFPSPSNQPPFFSTEPKAKKHSAITANQPLMQPTQPEVFLTLLPPVKAPVLGPSPCEVAYASADRN